MKKIIYIISLMLFISCSESKVDLNKDKDKEHIPVITKIAILHTNDTHGDLSYFPKLKTVLDKLKTEVDDVFIFNAGDIFSGDPYTDTYKPQGYPMIDLMNDLNYSVSVIGNHDFDYSQEVLKERIEQSNSPFILANIDEATLSFLNVKPYVILKAKNNISLAVVGLLSAHPKTLEENIKNIIFSDPKEVIKDYINLGNDNTLILLSHLGYDNDLYYAQKYSEIDVIIGGHSHTKVFEPEIINNTLVTQAGSKGYYVGEIILVFEDNTLIKKTGRLIQLDTSINDDSIIKEKVDNYYNTPSLKEIIGKAGDTFNGKLVIANLMSDSYRFELNVDFGMMNSGGVRNDYIPKGDITREKVYQFDPFNNDLVIISLKTDTLLEIVKEKLRDDENGLVLIFQDLIFY